MNGDIEQIKNNLFAITGEDGNVRIISTLKYNDESAIKAILKKEEDIKQIEQEINKKQTKLNNLKKINIHAEIINVLMYILLILLVVTFKPTSILQIIILGAATIATYTFVKTLNCSLLGTRIGRRNHKKDIDKNLEILKSLLENHKKEYEQLKKDAKFTVLTKTQSKNEVNHNYEFKHKSTNNIKPLTQQNPLRNTHTKKLTRSPQKNFNSKTYK